MTLRRHVAAWSFASFIAFAHGADAATWGCYQTKPGHPTAAERETFVREVSALAVQAEKAHGVPASALAAIAIAESGYGWTRLGLDANNLFAWRFVPADAAGRKSYVPQCEGRRLGRVRFMVFESRAEAFDFVAARLARLKAYRKHTEAYKAARRRGDGGEAAAKAWLSGIAVRYSGRPDEFARKIIRIMNNPVDPADAVSPHANLYRLSAGTRATR
jgi:uncharacterized FlgJ-related protein